MGCCSHEDGSRLVAGSGALSCFIFPLKDGDLISMGWALSQGAHGVALRWKGGHSRSPKDVCRHH